MYNKYILFLLLITKTCFISAQDEVTQKQIHKELPVLEFRVSDLDAAGKLNKFLVYNKATGELIQKLGGFYEKTIRYSSDTRLEFKDLNFDGYLDIYFEAKSKSALIDICQEFKENQKYCVWLYDPETSRFERNAYLEALPYYSLDSENKELRVEKFQLYAHCQSECTTYYFKWEGKQLSMIRSTYNRSNSDPNENYPEEKLLNITELKGDN